MVWEDLYCDKVWQFSIFLSCMVLGESYREPLFSAYPNTALVCGHEHGKRSWCTADKKWYWGKKRTVGSEWKEKKVVNARARNKSYLLKESCYEAQQSPCFMLLLPFLPLTSNNRFWNLHEQLTEKNVTFKLMITKLYQDKNVEARGKNRHVDIGT